ncbi:importin-7 [Sarcoptes scabiei]|nr:importin-7 [Sarcoptes scabiei]
MASILNDRERERTKQMIWEKMVRVISLLSLLLARDLKSQKNQRIVDDDYNKNTSDNNLNQFSFNNDWYTLPLSNSTFDDFGDEDWVLPRPVNMSVVLIQWYPPEVRLHWSYDRRALRNIRLQSFQIIYHPSKSRYRVIQEVPPFYSNLTLDRLQPGTEYTLRINAVSETGQTNQSRLLKFVSPDNETRRSHRKFINKPIHTYPDELHESKMVREDEVVIVVLVIAAWIGCIFIFFNKWGKIRMLEPYQPQYKESFPNSIHSLHPKTSRMNTCTSVPPNMISLESRGSLIPDRDLLFHHNRMIENGQLYQCASGTTYHHPAYRPRLNSVFVGNPYHRNSLYPEPNMPRKVKSAEDLKSLVVQVNNNVPSTSTSVL